MAYLLLRYLKIIIIRSVHEAEKWKMRISTESGGEREREATGEGESVEFYLSVDLHDQRMTLISWILSGFYWEMRIPFEADEKSPEQNAAKSNCHIVHCLFSSYASIVQFEDIKMCADRGSSDMKSLSVWLPFDGCEQRRIVVGCNGKTLKSNICIIWPHSSATFQIKTATDL